MHLNYSPLIKGMIVMALCQVFIGFYQHQVVIVTIACTSLVWLGAIWMLNGNMEKLWNIRDNLRQRLAVLESEGSRLQFENRHLRIENAHLREQVSTWQARAVDMMMEKGQPIPEELALGVYPFDVSKPDLKES